MARNWMQHLGKLNEWIKQGDLTVVKGNEVIDVRGFVERGVTLPRIYGYQDAAGHLTLNDRYNVIEELNAWCKEILEEPIVPPATNRNIRRYRQIMMALDIDIQYFDSFDEDGEGTYNWVIGQLQNK